MLDEQGHIDEGLLVKYLLGETEAQENLLVEKWLDASDENRQHLELLKQVWGSTAEVSFEVDTDAALNKLSARIEADEQDVSTSEPIVRSLKRPKWNWAAAAVILALVGLFGTFQMFFNGNEVLVASEGMVLEQALPDGSSIALNGNSKLSYPKEFDGDTRKVELKGEAFFDIKPNAEKPFIIDAGAGEIKVLGTSFNVEAFENNDLKVHVVTGRVQLSAPGQHKDSSMVILEAGNTGIISHQTGKVFKENPLYEDALFWLNKKLTFTKTPLPEVFQILEKNYGIHFSTYDNAVNSCLLTARFEGESISSILEVISATFNIQFDIDDQRVQVTSQDNNCAEG